MTRAELALLERAYVAEIDGALSGFFLPIQSKSKIAQKLVVDGMLAAVSVKIGGRLPITVSGFQLTHAGRFAYCATCKDEPEAL